MSDILILRGWKSSFKNWAYFITLLENQGYKVYSPDLPGFGDNLSLTKAWSIDDYVDWVKNFCEKQNLSQIFLLGHSFGGSIAIKYSLKFPKNVKKLFLVDSAGIRRKTFKKEITKKIAKFFKKFSFLPFYSLIRKIFYRTIIRKSDYFYTQGVMKETYLKIISEDLSSYLSRISVSTFIVWGKNDRLTPVKDAYLMKEKIAGAKLEIIPNIKHNPHFEAPEILVEKILNFLKS